MNYRRAFKLVSEYLKSGAFYTAIQSVGRHGMDMTGWLEYFVEGLAAQLAEIRGRGERAIQRDVLVEEHGLSERRSKALGDVMEHGSLRIQDYERLCPEANRRTLQRDLEALVDGGLLAERGCGPTDPTRQYLAGRKLRQR